MSLAIDSRSCGQLSMLVMMIGRLIARFKSGMNLSGDGSPVGITPVARLLDASSWSMVLRASFNGIMV